MIDLPWQTASRWTGDYTAARHTEKKMSSTIVFCTSYFEDQTAWKSRYRHWLDYHAKVFANEKLFMIDDGSPYLPGDHDIGINDDLENFVFGERGSIFHFPNRLGRIDGLNYPGWFRSFTFSIAIARRFNFNKIVHVESDTYVLTRAALNFIAQRKDGWTVFWCPRYNFPETSLQIICEDSFPAFEKFGSQPYETHYVNKRIEEVMPFTHIEKSIYGNRYGEYRARVPSYADFAVQVRPHTQLNSQFAH